MSIIRYIIYGILVTAVLSSCMNSVKDDLISTVNKECGDQIKSNCTIVFKKVTKFNWDKMYLFGDWTLSDSITRAIGFNYNGDDVPDDYTRMLFTDNHKVVYEEDFKSFDYYSSTLEFQGAVDSLYKARPYSLTVSKAIFKVEKGKTEGNCKTCSDYTLIPLYQ